MLAGQWEAARCAVSSAEVGEPRKALARALIPAAADAYAYGIAKALIEENHLEMEFPEARQYLVVGGRGGGGLGGHYSIMIVSIFLLDVSCGYSVIIVPPSTAFAPFIPYSFHPTPPP